MFLASLSRHLQLTIRGNDCLSAFSPLLRTPRLRLFAQRLTGVMAPTRILSRSLVNHSDL